MHQHHEVHKKCCGHHGHAGTLAVDERYAEDDFTQAAVTERRARAAHAHAGVALLSFIGGVLLFGLAKSVHRRVR